MSEYEQRPLTVRGKKRKDGEAMAEDYRKWWVMLEAKKELIEGRLAELESQHMELLGEMKVLAQEARMNGVTLSRYGWVRGLIADP